MIRAIAAFGVTLSLLASASAQEAKAPQTLEEKVASVRPAEQEERWLEIPWHTDLVEARAEAQRQGKPLFLWIMDGHPLACV
jgi:hypothetical protein